MTDTTVPQHLHPTTTNIAAHLTAEHINTGIAASDIASANPTDLLAWHDVDHRVIDPLYLGHTHGDTATTSATPRRDQDDEIRTATLKAIADGKPVPNLDDLLTRAAKVTARLATANQPDTPRIAGAGVASPYDRFCLDAAQAHADRAARTSKRRGHAA